MKKLNIKLIIAPFIFVMLLGAFFTSCNDDDSIDGIVGWVKLDQDEIRLKEGLTAEISPIFSDENIESMTYTWTTSDSTIATVSPDGENAIITAHQVGEATITLQSLTEDRFKTSCVVNVVKDADGIVKILAIGNSFSEDAVEQNLYDIATAAGYDVVIGNMYIGGCDLETHLSNANSDASAYSYRKIEGGVKTTTASYKLSDAIADENWDYISVQQASGQSGLVDSYSSTLAPLVSYIEGKATNEDVEVVYHQTWAYAATSTHSEFVNYDNDQTTMYNAIMSAVQQVTSAAGISVIIPSGTTIQNARTSYIGDKFTRDGYHLEYTYARYAVACAWFETLFGEDVTNNSYQPLNITSYNTELARQAAHYAGEQKYQVTTMSNFSDYNSSSNTELIENPIYIDFGSSSEAYTSESPWNNVSTFGETAPFPLYDEDGINNDVTIEVTDAFGGINTTGATETTTGYPSTVTGDSFYTNGFEWGSTAANETGGLLIRSLNKDQDYTLSFFSSRSATDNRETKYIVSNGVDTEELNTNAASNSTELVTTTPISPNDDGEITITVTYGDNNNNANRFFFINSLVIQPQ